MPERISAPSSGEAGGEGAGAPGRAGGWGLALLAGLIVGASFWRAIGNGFVEWDDPSYVFENPGLRGLDLDVVRGAFAEFHAGLWIPATWLSLALDAAVSGADPRAFHLTNVVLHAATAGLLAAVASRLIEASPAAGGGARGAALLGGALAAVAWGVHPLRVESVAWVAERKDVLGGLFFVGTAWAWLRRCSAAPGSRSRGAWTAGAVAAAVLATMSKPVGVVLPLVLLLIDVHPLGRLERREQLLPRVVEKWPFLLVAAIGGVLTVVAQQQAMLAVRASFAARALIACRSLLAYAWMTAWPVRLSPFHLHPGNAVLGSSPYLLAPAAVAGLAAAAWRLRRRAPSVPALSAYFAVACLPTLGLVQVGPQELADRFTYLPGIAPALLLGGAAAVVLERARSSPGARIRAGALLAAVAVLLSWWIAITQRQIGFWRDDRALWSRVTDLDPGIGLAHDHLAWAHMRAGAPEEALREATLSIGIAERRGYSKIAELYFERAGMQVAAHRAKEAVEDLSQAIARSPAPSPTYLEARSAAYEALGDPVRAAEDRLAAAALRAAAASPR